MKTSKFKMTEIGEIPADWEVKRLGDIGLFSKGAGISRAQANSGKIPAVRYGELYTTHHNYIKRFESFISDEVAKESTQLTYGDIVFACSGETKEEIGKCAAFLGSEVAYAGGDLIILSPRNGYDSKFLAFELNAPFCALQKASAGQGDAVVHIRRESLENLIVVIPPLAEQKAIAEALSDVDALIAAQEELIEKKRAIKQGAMQELLTGKKRLPGFGGKCRQESLEMEDFNAEAQRRRGSECKMTEVGLIPVDWEVKRLGEVCNVYDGTHQTPHYVDNGIQFYSVENVTANDFTNVKYISEEEHIALSKRIKVERGDVLMTRIGSIGVCRYINWDVEASYYVSLALLKKKYDAQIDMCFLAHLSESELFKKEVMLRSLQFAIPMKINLGKISEIRLCLPPLAEQKAIAEVLSDMDAEISELEAQKAKFESIKQGMMQELLTGKTRLKGA